MNSELEDRIEYFMSKQAVGRSTQVNDGIGVGSSKGPVREENQDRAAVAYIVKPSGEALLIALICDGMGGMKEGGAAAGCAAGTFLARLAVPSGAPIGSQILGAVNAANAEVHRRFRGDGGTTLTALVIKGSGEAWVTHVGDSRLYVSRSDRSLDLLTRDDTIGGQLNQITDANEDNLDNRLLQFVGIGKTIEPHIFPVSDALNSTFIITSDGAHSIGKKSLERISRNSRSPGELARKITYVAEAMGVEDNSSAVVIYANDFSPSPRFARGTELTLWSPSERLEMWLASPREVDQPSQEESQPTGQPVAKTKKAARSPRKTNKQAGGNKGRVSENEIEKPQLNIEFNSKSKKQE
ncbi:PP2C family protein-serine/threonine phosphatase [Mesorhizobium helmanticense]|uniref:PP2C family protein-serine/threonine phosphatase n=1 Tax=Mesorhizobium helmanticense TaxID=1776423 RepID=UPI0011B26CB3|nr:protein phosphatase 2C domain-containing protein [Mesorhizobium helmanticense]